MPASPESKRSRRPCRAFLRRSCRGGGFTLIELIFVLALLAIGALFVASRMGAFIRGRALNFEARRLLSLSHYAQSRAVAEGVPIVLWVNAKDSTYGIAIQSTFGTTGDDDIDVHAVSYTAESSVTLEAATGPSSAVSEQEDERLGVTEGLAAIRFNPDGFFDESSVIKITLRQGTEAGLELVQTANRLAYEIRPASNAD